MITKNICKQDLWHVVSQKQKNDRNLCGYLWFQAFEGCTVHMQNTGLDIKP